MDGAGRPQGVAGLDEPGRGEVLRDLVVFQGKLVLDGLRDLLLSPVSLVAGLISLFGSGANRGLFYRIVQFGRSTERWINLFGAADKVPGQEQHDAPPPETAAGLDEVIGRVEHLLLEEYRRGGVTATAREALSRALARRRGRPADPPQDEDPSPGPE